MADFPSFQDLFRIARDEALARNGNLTREVIERQGTDANIFTAAIAAVGDEVIGQLTSVEAALYLDSAKGTKLDRLVFDRFNLPRKSAAPALGSVEFSTTTANPLAFSIPVGTKLGTVDGKQFITTVAALFPFGSVGPVAVAMQSTSAGAKQQAAIGTITSILGTIPSSPADLVVTNATATAGAADDESDDDYRARARLFFDSVRRGTAAAVRAKSLETPGVLTADAFEYLDALGRPMKAAQLIISDTFTESLVAAIPTPAAYQTQSQVLADAVYSNLSDTRPIGIFIDVRVAIVVLQGVTLGLSFAAGVDVDSVALQARAAVVGYINELSPGQPLMIDGIIAYLQRVPGLVVTGGEVLSPSGDVIPETLQVLRTSLGLVVATSVQPDRALQGSANPDGP